MKLELTEKQYKTIKFALYLAEEWEDSVYDSYKTDLKIINGKPITSIMKEWQKEANKALQNSKDFRSLLNMLKERDAK